MQLPTFEGTCYFHLGRSEPRFVSYGGPLTEAFHSTRDKEMEPVATECPKSGTGCHDFPLQEKTSFSFTIQSRGFCDMTGRNYLHCSSCWNEDKSPRLDYMCSDEE